MAILSDKEKKIYLRATYWIDCDNDLIIKKTQHLTKHLDSEVEKAKKLFYFVRDEIEYTVYVDFCDEKIYRASHVLLEKRGYCVQKAILLAALARAANIPSRLHFADIKNRKVKKKLIERRKSDIFIYHGFTELYLLGKWVAATPTFDIKTSKALEIEPVEFDGINDARLPAFDIFGKKAISYVKDRGIYDDLPPLKTIIEERKKYLPNGYFEMWRKKVFEREKGK